MACHDQLWLSPCSLQQLASMLQQHGRQAQLVSGNTGATESGHLIPQPGQPDLHTACMRAEIDHNPHGTGGGGGGCLSLQGGHQTPQAPCRGARG
jgi:hypothetical protein